MTRRNAGVSPANRSGSHDVAEVLALLRAGRPQDSRPEASVTLGDAM